MTAIIIVAIASVVIIEAMPNANSGTTWQLASHLHIDYFGEDTTPNTINIDPLN